MSRKVYLSNSAIVFNLKSAGISSNPDRFNLCIDLEEYDMPTIEAAFTGNDIITIAEINDETQEIISKTLYYDWTQITAVAKDNSYYEGEDPETHEPILVSVWNITLQRVDINRRMSDAEDAIDDIINTILG